MNDDTLEWLELKRKYQNATLDKWTISFLTEDYYITISGGEGTASYPPIYLEHIKYYSTVVMELYHRGENISKEVLDAFNATMDIGGYTPNIVVFTHKALYPLNEEFMQDQPWAEKFRWTTHGSAPTASLTLNELDLVMKHLVKLEALLAFK